MSSGTTKRTRSDHVAQLDLPPNRMERALAIIRRGDVLNRLGICSISILIMWAITGGWSLRMPYREGATPNRDIVARQTFERDDEERTRLARQRERELIECVYGNDVQVLRELREGLKQRVRQIVDAESFATLDPEIWAEFYNDPDNAATSESTYESFLAALADDPDLQEFGKNIDSVFEPIDRFGVLDKIQHDYDKGRQTEITVRRNTDGHIEHRVPVNSVLRSAVVTQLDKSLNELLDAPVLRKHVGSRIKKLLPITLSYDPDASNAVADAREAAVAPVKVVYEAGKTSLVEANKTLTEDDIQLLQLEHTAWLNSRTWVDRLTNSIADLGMYIALYVLCGAYLFHRRHDLLKDLRRLMTLQVIVVATVVLAWFTATDSWQAELIPLMLFAITVSLVYSQELALLLSASVCLVVVLAIRQGLDHFVILMAGLAVTILLLREVRSRTKLIYIGIIAGLATSMTTLGVCLVMGESLDTTLLTRALWLGFYATVSGILMTGLLPFVEYLLSVQTDISLLELADVAQPLLQELVRRAPGTYNHSINVASLAESAAESIGANGLLVRVGAYFHDIGKMLKPQYFIENQSGGNRHEDLLPAMSTLIIIAHVKDGADLARQHHLPQPIIDFILQHHGTTLVEFFYDRAHKQSEADPDLGEVDEGSYRYPGPKPQTREAAVLMLADGVESASRSLQDPAPARIESLVDDIAMKRLLDGQFDECGLTLQELRVVQDSLVKSLAAVYHGRVKYPDQATA